MQQRNGKCCQILVFFPFFSWRPNSQLAMFPLCCTWPLISSIFHGMPCRSASYFLFYVLFPTSKSYLRFYVLFFPAQSIWNFRWLWYISLKWYFSITKINKWNVAWELEGDMKWVETAEMIVLKESILLKEPNLIQFHQNSVKRVWILHSLAWS